jgi:hypothetical protein
MLAKTPNRKRATEYLAACGATAITIIDRDGAIVTGKTTSGIVGARWWIAAQDAQRVASAARRLAEESPDVATAIAAVQRSAGLLSPSICDIEFIGWDVCDEARPAIADVPRH